MSDINTENTSGSDEKELKKEIRNMEKEANTAFKEKQFDNAKTFIEKIRSMDSDNTFAEKLTEKIQKAEDQAIREKNADQIKTLKADIKSALKESRFDTLRQLAEELSKVEPNSSFADKFLTKAAKIEEKEAKKKEKMAQKETEKQESPAPTAAPEKKRGFLGNLFKKSAPQDNTDVALPAAAIPTPSDEGPARIDIPKPSSSEIINTKEKEGGNVFTKVFGKKDDFQKSKESIIDTIVAKSSDDSSKAKKAKEKIKPLKEKDPMESEKKREGTQFLAFSRMFFHFSAAFILLTLGFFYVQNIDESNTVLKLVGIEENYAQKLHNANEALEGKKSEADEIQEDIDLYVKGYSNEYEKVIQGIIDSRINWPDIMEKINNIADSIYERNDVFQYIVFNSFSFDAKAGTVNVNGTLTDPLGKNLTKLAELEQAFRYFPGSKENQDDDVKPYFYNVRDLNAFSKSYNTKTNRYSSGFQFSFSIYPPTAESSEAKQ